MTTVDNRAESTVTILGCGYVGTAMARVLCAQGHPVVGTTTRAERLPEIGDTGARGAIARLDDPESLRAALAGSTVALMSAAAGRGGDYEAVYLRGARAFVEALDPSVVEYAVFLSATSVYGQDDGSLVDEDSPVEPPTPRARVLRRSELAFLSAAQAREVDALILRLSGIWGPGRDPAEWMARRGPVHPGDGAEYLNLVHLDDIVAALAAAILRRPTGLLNLSNPHPLRRCDFYPALAASLGCESPRFERPLPSPDHARGKRVDGRRATRVLDLTLRFPHHPGCASIGEQP